MKTVIEIMINDVDGEDHDAWVWVRLENLDDYDDESQQTRRKPEVFFAQLWLWSMMLIEKNMSQTSAN